MTFEPVIGLEVHAQLLTRSKLFCACSAAFGAAPNAHTCPVCMAFPGVLPVVNRQAVEFAIRAGLAAGCRIAPVSQWARKNYFYPDLPKAYQISMYEAPICVGGRVSFTVGGEHRAVRLTRIHLEEDAGKSIHDAHADSSLVDLNRAGVPLLEIVSEPELGSPAEAAAYLKSLRSIVQYLEICDGNMEEGSFRCDANISVRPAGGDRLGTRAEVKNMNSFRAVERALEHEIARQIAVVSGGGQVVQETRLWDAEREVTRPMRSKEFAHDYRYFPEPDLPPLVVDEAWVERVRAGLPELPSARRVRFVRDLGLPDYDAEVLTARRDVADYFEAAAGGQPNAKAIGNWVMESVLRIVRERRLDDPPRIRDWPVAPEALADLVALIDRGTISGKIAKTVFDEMVASGRPPREIVESRGLVQLTDAAAIAAAVDRVIAAHGDKVAEYRSGKEKLFGFFVGQVMKATEGKANPKQVNDLLRERLRG
ncbi:MAG: Asp-tRNA(Asn)/Glu-tRNA(Gln) amidotransferase subunit GatB [Deltaproteobacteria bacterium]|nr:Asp-tRNA(Asn)/Glu-tRNA(Gln) amidotransferase subunit GatB [Deltaproteobacteria bacterium]